MTEVILRHRVREFIQDIVGSVDMVGSGVRRHYHSYIEWAFFFKMIDELKIQASQTPYDFLELSVAEDFTRSKLCLEPSITERDWEEFTREKFVRKLSGHETTYEHNEYFTEWTQEVSFKLLRVINGDYSAEVVLEDKR
jgi:hypothetical protein